MFLTSFNNTSLCDVLVCRDHGVNCRY